MQRAENHGARACRSLRRDVGPAIQPREALHEVDVVVLADADRVDADLLVLVQPRDLGDDRARARRCGRGSAAPSDMKRIVSTARLYRLSVAPLPASSKAFSSASKMFVAPMALTSVDPLDRFGLDFLRRGHELRLPDLDAVREDDDVEERVLGERGDRVLGLALRDLDLRELAAAGLRPRSRPRSCSPRCPARRGAASSAS